MSLETYSPDPQLLRQAFSHFPSGVAAFAAEVDGRLEGMVASSFSVGVSMDPPLVMFAIQNSSTTWPVLRSAGRIGVSVMGAGHDGAARQLASRNKAGRFEGLEIERSEAGAVFVHGSPLWLECSIFQEIPAGDHHVVLLQVTALHNDATIEPLVFHGSAFRHLRSVA
ncbi:MULTISPECIES: flavin reductase family protein [unclassified Rathayibacter]|uniref:flavin reductase family protein n=1 Tax=unclassified Rathayibacter TaxID=2609250 RepID=UPI0006FD465A|nr:MULTISPECIES: flavin reductase family protein [unclassified Rathayibacter]KQQ05624.1 oxidoreductase [Rathayibacter sp. Leaf294]KQS14236.1 oxidoreductase [Rathayibacter sp. Leaf185]